MDKMKNKITIEFTKNELGEIAAKLANQIEIYQDSATNDLINGFLKVMRKVKEYDEEIYHTTLMNK